MNNSLTEHKNKLEKELDTQQKQYQELEDLIRDAQQKIKQTIAMINFIIGKLDLIRELAEENEVEVGTVKQDDA